MSRIGVMVCGHGSRDEEAIAEFESVAAGIRARLPGYDVESGFLEFAIPVIREGLGKLRARGNELCLAVPGMLFAAGHAKNDIPSVLNTFEAEHPEMEIRYARELGIDDKLLRAAGDRIREALDAAGDGVPRHETMLVVVGRGASDPDANSNVAKVMRMLWEGFGFGWGETAYSGVTFPLVEPALLHTAKLGYRRIVVFPYFLFTGVLVKRIYAHTDRVAARHPEIEFVKAPYLNDHPAVLDAFAERVEETLHGANLMNCKLCKYRERILGFEAEKGLPQESHHHHVEGIGTGSTGRGHRDHAHDHDHGHGLRTTRGTTTGTIMNAAMLTITGTTIPTRTPATPSARRRSKGVKTEGAAGERFLRTRPDACSCHSHESDKGGGPTCRQDRSFGNGFPGLRE